MADLMRGHIYRRLGPDGADTEAVYIGGQHEEAGYEMLLQDDSTALFPAGDEGWTDTGRSMSEDEIERRLAGGGPFQLRWNERDANGS